MRDTPVSFMDFRTDPLPSYEDIISGNFPKKSAKDKENKSESAFIPPQFKYVNKISEPESEVEEGELLSENDEEVTKRKNVSSVANANKNANKKVKHDQNSNNNNKNTRNNKNSSKINNNSNNNTRAQNDSAKDFTSNIIQNTFVPRLVCRYFMEGICSKGDKCTFSHAVIPNKTPEEARVKEPCKFFIMGSCMKGDTCYYSHDLSVVPCKFFHLRGECATVNKGGQCRFSHAPIDKETLEKLRQSESEKIKEKLAAENNLIQTPNNSNEDFINNFDTNSRTKNEESQTCKETETSTQCPHEQLLNPFAFSGSDIEDGEY